MLKIASWNVNSIKMRLEQVLLWMQQSNTDVLAVQETKAIDAQFPQAIIEAAGFEVVFAGQKSYNGVAIISKQPLSQVCQDVPGYADPQRRVLSASIGDIRIVNVYVPNGASLDSEKYQYKLEWLQQVHGYIAQQLKQFPKLVMLGDYNIAPEDLDVHEPMEWAGGVLVSEAERDAYRALCALGLNDSFRLKHPEVSQFSWWDYRAASFRRNRGLRIDLILVSQALEKALHNSGIDAEPRQWDKPSDHTPVWAELIV